MEGGVFFFWFLFAILMVIVAAGVLAPARRRDPLAWGVVTFLFWPAVLILWLLPGTPGEMKPCPRCAEDVKTAALVCRYCGHEFAG